MKTKTLLTTSALAALLVIGTGAGAQTTPATPPATDPAPAAPAAQPTPGTMAVQPAEPARTPVDIATLSRDDLIGADIKTVDGDTVASVDDVVTDATGHVSNIVARFGGFLGFGETTVLLQPDEVAATRDEGGTVELMTTLTPEALKDRPEYKSDNG